MENALKKFVDFWLLKKNVIGILLSGSYAVGLENKNSDIDIRIIFNNKCKKSIKGLNIIDGYKFSYLGRASDITEKRFCIDFFNNNKFEARIFSIGKILYDKDNSVKRLAEIAKAYVTTPFIKRKITREDINMNMYILYSRKINLESLPEGSPFFNYYYFSFLKQAISWYSNFLGYEFFIDSKTEKILTDDAYRKIYLWDKFPDQIFIQMWIESLNPNKLNKHSIISLYSYLEKKIIKIDEKKFTISWIET